MYKSETCLLTLLYTDSVRPCSNPECQSSPRRHVPLHTRARPCNRHKEKLYAESCESHPGAKVALPMLGCSGWLPGHSHAVAKVCGVVCNSLLCAFHSVWKCKSNTASTHKAICARKPPAVPRDWPHDLVIQKTHGLVGSTERLHTYPGRTRHGPGGDIWVQSYRIQCSGACPSGRQRSSPPPSCECNRWDPDVYRSEDLHLWRMSHKNNTKNRLAYGHALFLKGQCTNYFKTHITFFRQT